MKREGSRYAASIVETVREPLVLLDEHMRVRIANASFYRTFRASREATEGRTLFELGNGQWEIPALRTCLAQLLAEGRSFEDLEVVHDFPHIGRRVMSLNARALDEPASAERLILLAIEDVTTRRNAEVALAWHTREVERSNRELEEFAYIASHDLQEPLRKIRAYGDLLLSEYGAGLGEEGRDYVERMIGASARMQSLINDLLALSRVATSPRTLRLVDLGAVAREVLGDLEIAIADAQGTVHVDPLPTIEADRLHMRQLFQNLIGNALKFRRPDVPLRIRIEARPTEPDAPCEIAVVDNGIGFEARHADLIFAPFQRLHGRTAYEGTGMGLTICRRIVERNAGSLVASSTPGEGSSFIITLPARQPNAE